MKLVSFINKNSKEKIGLLNNSTVLDLSYDVTLPSTMAALLNIWELKFEYLKLLNEAFLAGKVNTQHVYQLEDLTLLAPVPKPTSCRDGYAFRQHVESARRNRGVEMIKEFDQYPIFYFTNHNSVIGPGDVKVNLDQLDKCDFELEVAVVIGKHGRDIPAADADSYIAGYTIMNDLSARTLQMEEMLLNLGPAKGKDFATSIGPFMITKDELEKFKVDPPKNHTGSAFNLKMKAFHNGKQISEGNVASMDWTFAEIIERVSYGVDIYPGDVIGSGTVGSGCYLELNGTWAREAKEKGDSFSPIWLKDGDSIVLEIDQLGRLENKIKKVSDVSILAKKKMN